MKQNKMNLVGKTFGKIKVLQFSHKDAHGNMYYTCRCLCGTIKIIAGNHLVSRRVISCGCSKRRSGNACGQNRQMINLRMLLRTYLEEMKSSAVYIVIDEINTYVRTRPEYNNMKLVMQH